MLALLRLPMVVTQRLSMIARKTFIKRRIELVIETRYLAVYQKDPIIP